MNEFDLRMLVVLSERCMKERAFFSKLLLFLSITSAAFLSMVAILYGIEFTDTGFVLGLAHRIAIGQRIYFDFDYVRPPLTPLLWSFPLRLEIEAKELLIRLLVLLQKIATATGLYQIVRTRGVNRIPSLWVGIISFGFLVHHLPLMPWHTTDGLFFASFAVFFYAYNFPLVSFIFAVMSALTKQSFYLFPVIIFSLSIVYFRRSRLILTCAVVIIGFALSGNPYLKAFSSISVEGTSLKDFLHAAVSPHFKVTKWSALFVGLLFLLSMFYKKRSINLVAAILILFPIFNMTYHASSQWLSSGKISFAGTDEGVTHLAMMVSVVHLFAVLARTKMEGLRSTSVQLALLLLAAAWMSTISWGYANYLFGYGFILSANIVLLSEKNRKFDSFLWAICLVTLTAFFLLRLISPYRMEGPLFAEYKPVQFGHYKYVRASMSDLSKLNSLQIIGNMEGCREIYPASPQAALISSYSSVLRADWKMDIEFPSFKSAESVLLNKACKLFVEKDDRVIGWQGKFASSAIDLQKYKKCLVDFDVNFSMIDFSKCKL
jgi:hypothetical protein